MNSNKTAKQEIFLKELVVSYWEKYGELPNAEEKIQKVMMGRLS